MKTNTKFWTILVLVSILLTACTLPWSPAPATVSPPVMVASATPFQPSVSAASATPMILAQDPAIENVAPPAALEPCSLTDGTAQIQIKKSGNEWIVDPRNLVVVAGYNNTAPGHDVSQLSGCDMWAEFESNHSKEHFIFVLRDTPGAALAYLAADGLFHINQPKGGSFWVGPAYWNTADFGTQKPPIAYEMAAERNANQLTNVSGAYDWPEIVYSPDETTKVFPVGFQYGAYYTGCDDLADTAPFYVAGTILGSQFVASIGMKGCYIAVKLDGQWTYWQNAKDNVLYGTAEAYLFPKSASESDVQAWIASQ